LALSLCRPNLPQKSPSPNNGLHHLLRYSSYRRDAMSDRLLRVGCLVSASVGFLIGCERGEAPGGQAREFGIVSTAQAAAPSAAPATARPAVLTRQT